MLLVRLEQLALKAQAVIRGRMVLVVLAAQEVLLETQEPKELRETLEQMEQVVLAVLQV